MNASPSSACENGIEKIAVWRFGGAAFKWFLNGIGRGFGYLIHGTPVGDWSK